MLENPPKRSNFDEVSILARGSARAVMKFAQIYSPMVAQSLLIWISLKILKLFYKLYN